MHVENLYSHTDLLRVSNLHLTKLLENSTEVGIDQTYFNLRIFFYSISVLSGLIGLVYKYLPPKFNFLLLLSVIVYFASQLVVFVLESIIYSKISIILRYKLSKFHVYTSIDESNGDFTYSVFPSDSKFDPNLIERVPLGALFYQDGNTTNLWESIASNIVSLCKTRSSKYK